MYSYKELESSLYKWAHYFSKRYNRQFEPNELINEVWLREGIQKLKSVKFASGRIKFDMMDYIKDFFHRRRKKPLNEFSNIEEYVFENIKNRRNEIKEIDDRDSLNYSLQFLNNKEKEILFLYYFSGFTMKEVGEIIGVTESSISSKISKAIKNCRNKLEEIGMENG